MNNGEVEKQQRAFCQERSTLYVAAELNKKVGFALETVGLLPINGLRHPPVGDTTGWYIWCGESLSQEPEFFSPLHTVHVLERCPESTKFLGLPPGYRFLIAGDYADIWFDESLLNV